MKWPWKKNRPEPLPELELKALPSRERAEAEKKRAERTLEESRSSEREVSQISRELRSFRERNHFADRISDLAFRHGGV